jgi:hypothetical protein
MWPPTEVIVVSPDVSPASSSELIVKEEVKKEVVTTEDLARFMKMLDGTDGGPAWSIMMDKAVPDMTYQAWRRDPEEGPTQYKSRTVFENLSPEFIRDFFWDDQFRAHWDDMLIYSKVWEEDQETGALVVQWVRKYPFFCKDREYIIGRRIYEHNGTYYCVCQGTHYPQVPRQHTPRRVDVFWSSWRIRAVESAKGDGQMTACEVMLFHHEEMGIQKDLAKLGIRQGMWGCVKKMEPGIMKYKASRKAGEPLTQSALAAQKSTKVPRHLLTTEPDQSSSSKTVNSTEVVVVEDQNMHNRGYLKWVVLGGAVALACGIDRGAVGKFLVFGVAKRLGRVGRRM